VRHGRLTRLEAKVPHKRCTRGFGVREVDFGTCRAGHRFGSGLPEPLRMLGEVTKVPAGDDFCRWVHNPVQGML
jgi:hypothetical protein